MGHRCAGPAYRTSCDGPVPVDSCRYRPLDVSYCRGNGYFDEVVKHINTLMVWLMGGGEALAATPILAPLPAGASPPSPAELRLPRILGDNVVLQREKPVGIWGWAEPGEKVDVSFAGTVRSATADGQGVWNVKLPALAANRSGMNGAS